MHPSVVVIGAGASGLSAAGRLQQAGLSVTVLEGRNRLGGRILTDSFTGFDLGASWIHGTIGNPISHIAAENQIALIDSPNRKVIYNSQGVKIPHEVRDRVEKQFEEKVEEICRKSHQGNPEKSLPDLLRQEMPSHFNQDEQSVWKWLVGLRINIDGGPASISSFAEYEEGSLEGDNKFIRGGYKTIVDILSRGLNIELQAKVTRISYSSAGVTVEGIKNQSDAFKRTFDFAIVTLPLGVLQHGSVEFSPPLPYPKTQAISQLRPGIMEKIVFWDPQVEWIGVADDTFHVFFVNGFGPLGKPVLVTWAEGDQAITMENYSESEIADVFLPYLRLIFPGKVTQLEKCFTTRWHTDPFSLGSYSYSPLGSDGRDREILAQSLLGRVFFAGEATHRIFYGTVHGAFLSGKKAAEQILSLVLQSKL